MPDSLHLSTPFLPVTAIRWESQVTGYLPWLSTSFHFLFWLLSKVLISEFSILFPRHFNFTLLGNYIWLLNFLVNPSRTAIDQYCHNGQINLRAKQKYYVLSATSCFHGFIVQFELVKHKFLTQTIFHVHLRGFQITYSVEQCTMCQRTSYQDSFERDSRPSVARSWTLAVEEKEFAWQSIGYCFTD